MQILPDNYKIQLSNKMNWAPEKSTWAPGLGQSIYRLAVVHNQLIIKKGFFLSYLVDTYEF